jgi:hypothetical protein
MIIVTGAGARRGGSNGGLSAASLSSHGRPPEYSPMLINCAAYHDGRKLADIPIADISDA